MIEAYLSLGVNLVFLIILVFLRNQDEGEPIKVNFTIFSASTDGYNYKLKKLTSFSQEVLSNMSRSKYNELKKSLANMDTVQRYTSNLWMQNNQFIRGYHKFLEAINLDPNISYIPKSKTIEVKMWFYRLEPTLEIYKGDYEQKEETWQPTATGDNPLSLIIEFPMTKEEYDGLLKLIAKNTYSIDSFDEIRGFMYSDQSITKDHISMSEKLAKLNKYDNEIHCILKPEK